MSRYLIRNGIVLTLGARTANHPRADVLIEEGRISGIGGGLRSRGAEVIEAEDTVVMPGFVDTHRHAWRSLFRNYGEANGSGALAPDRYGPHYKPDDVYAATLIGLLGAVESGTTTVVDWADAGLGIEHLSAVLQAHRDSGLRTVLVVAPPTWEEPSDPAPALRNLSAGEGLSGTTTLAVGVQEAGDVAAVESARAVAAEMGLRTHIHAGVDPDRAGTATTLADRGLLDDATTLVHCSYLDAADLDAVAKSGAGVSITPAAEMAGGLGAPPIQSLLSRSIRPGLGVDDERVAPGDMFAQMRATNSIQHASTFDLKLAGKAGLPTLLTTRDVIRYATFDGARAVGLADRAGSLEVGKPADVLVLRADRPNIAPINDPIGAVVWGMDTSNVDWVFADGRPLISSGSPTTDITRARDLAVAAQRNVAGASGLVSGGVT